MTNKLKFMRRVFAGLLACAALVAHGQEAMTMQEARKRLPLLANLPDDSFANVVHQKYYADMDKAEFFKWIGHTPPPPKIPKTLGPVDRWRYESCQTDAAKAPTSQGVHQGMRVCRDKFGQ